MKINIPLLIFFIFMELFYLVNLGFSFYEWHYNILTSEASRSLSQLMNCLCFIGIIISADIIYRICKNKY